MRYWVYRALYEVIVHQVYSNLYLKNNLYQVDCKDQALATNIFYGTIQNYSFCQYVWKQYAHYKVSDKIDVLLSMSVYQLIFLDKVPSYAIVNEAIEIAKKEEPRSKGFVNAILRKINKNKINYPENEFNRLSIQYSLPVWLLKMWDKQYGSMQMRNMLPYCNQIMPLYIRYNPNYTFETTYEHICGTLYKTNLNQIANNQLYKDGKISVQDEGSYQICLFLDIKENMNVLDCCAAPGTKSMAIAEMLHHSGHVDCIELHEHRKELIEKDIQRLSLNNVSCFCQDARDLSSFLEYDRVLCDVPCSGYGVLSRKPDIKLKMKPEDMDTLIPLQYEILESASKHVKKGGILVYSTCTINKKENEKQIEKFIENHSNYECLEMKTIFPQKEKDGFYMAKLKRID
ncbi:MAG: 16S rRNA (cytosine(967)-C(5))-methyltransferase RsmB [Floccifex porci]|uniref:16S rRNA (cytosine(967)-C(5))-methyltransferase n=1 Tax=Floccifex porci TaxID=2606629 RepID=A0A7X2N3Y0_9FIRM|nr:16S rRNA (cytosine(967)-C(5))-methyltransferase RsmB [Floccifex porci]MCI7802051.1 16S rRNA (cytosine(967)-C(5))-methyltransferase RsmB [Erysipelotrichaceae bacterium]MDD7467899.1 16S rRNA (cytosine(967)-C(5))-methyltransferase RsmB [Floccifex porci]MDO4480347.1 16S rRNA (cytosine(967)-C(5))-methyltransferase RsmB [Erysipelotrichaceae bacterium]MDY4796888.1 16S rRNA (cytosine(967)-C(5))-methyltransferase RsmB [Floccifex porci]MSS02002.1 16S rRNA (cytosine(967)-C(5))-methyltransferase RsmB [